MKTEIFENYSAFLKREDKTVNGVDQDFAEEFPDYEKMNETNKACWRCSGCSDCTGCYGCSDCSDCSDCSRCTGCYGCSDCSRCTGCYGCCSDCSRCTGCYGCSGCSDCTGCYGCSDCSDCSDCSRCTGCYGCSDCSDCYGLKNAAPVETKQESTTSRYPIIPNIHQTILDAVTKEGELKMSSWHDSEAVNEDGAYCGTTHCRAGWVVAKAGKAGRDLEDKVGTPHAAMMIYHASCPEVPVAPVRFYESNEIAMADIKRCAELERSLIK